jgi:hypothetical protein
MNRNAFYITMTLVVLAFSGAARAQATITKCQDADGNWHYGDFAAEACAQDSKITEIDQRGIQVRETDAPPTQQEIDARKKAEEQARLEAEREAEQRRRDNQLLQTYDSAAAIEEARDARLDALDREMESHLLFQQDLVDEKESLKNNEQDSERMSSLDEQIQQYDQAIAKLKSERQAIIDEYDADLERYRALTDG